jgi:NADH-quinone oxidoreductase subunit J
MVIYITLILGACVCAIFAVRSKPLHAALWLAGLSAIITVLCYMLGAREIAVIELSVGAGLITVLLAFAISMAEDEKIPVPLIPRPLAWFLVVFSCGLLAFLILPQISLSEAMVATDPPFAVQVWEARLLDLFVQLIVVLAGVMGILSLLGESKQISDMPEQAAIEGIE